MSISDDSKERGYLEDIKCLACGHPIVRRANATTGNQFYGCSQYPRCEATRTLRSVDEEVQVIIGDHPEDRLGYMWNPGED